MISLPKEQNNKLFKNSSLQGQNERDTPLIKYLCLETTSIAFYSSKDTLNIKETLFHGTLRNTNINYLCWQMRCLKQRVKQHPH